ncbi:diablo IAP-binding mitochondrial protein isoform X3 [Hippoglossus stenolepis]|uniref:diablo IAP-binding mitochondrial protein isoform X3 n=1 Tax=Hippoglossus stenolepis TaxID=195615 RepID=UPI00159C5005|nr:diablo IAP-binding mitochondrial protein isoform X3 [Hippoglossus stenolepis]
MQVVRQCSASASRAAGGFLRNPTDMSLLPSRRGATCSRDLSSSESGPLSSRKCGVQKSGEWTSAAHMSIASLSVARGLFTQAVHTRIAVQRRYLASVGKLTSSEEDSHKQAINAMRAEVTYRLEECKRFESSWINAVNLCKMAAEAANTSGAEQASITVRTNIQVAQSQVEEARRVSADAEKKLAETKVEEIQRMAEYAASFDDEEHEVHEAYLRED